MKISNSSLALALALGYKHALHRALAQAICDRPNSRRFNVLAEKLLGLRDIPDEAWAAPVPTVHDGEAFVDLAVQRLSQEYDFKNLPENRLKEAVALRRLAWYASQLARRIEHDDSRAFIEAVAVHGGHTANIFHPPMYHPIHPATIKAYGAEVKLDSADGRNAVLMDGQHAVAAMQPVGPRTDTQPEGVAA